MGKQHQRKILALAENIYGASDVNYTPEAQKKLTKISKLKLDNLPICIAKTPRSFSDDQSIKNVPGKFKMIIRDIDIAAGAGFIVPLAGSILRMPGLPKTPAATQMDINEDGFITGLN